MFTVSQAAALLCLASAQFPGRGGGGAQYWDDEGAPLADSAVEYYLQQVSPDSRFFARTLVSPVTYTLARSMYSAGLTAAEDAARIRASTSRRNYAAGAGLSTQSGLFWIIHSIILRERHPTAVS